jgi:glycosyltransferase involved in cell wall biosynthesis
MPTYNNEAFLKQAIGSVFLQSFQDWELIIIDDGCTDGTKEIVSGFLTGDNKVVYVKHEQQMGLVFSLNQAVALAKGEYLARLDGDDAWISKTKLEKQVEFLNGNSDYGLIGTWAEVCSVAGKKLYNFKPAVLDLEIRRQILLRNCFIHSSILVRKDALKQAGGYKADKKYVEDYSLWLELGKKYKFGNIPEIMVSYRVNKSGVTQTKNKEQIKAALALIKEYKGAYPQYNRALFKWSLQYILSFVGLTWGVNFLKQFLK